MNFTLRNQGQLITSSTPLVMGIVNATPDSFFEGSRFTADSTGFKRIDSMVADGVDIIDVGGQSTRPGAERITEKEELKRIVPVIEGIKERYPNAFVSIDTFYGSVADAAFQAGAASQVAYTFKRLGGDVLDIELTAGNIYNHYEEACLEYSYIVNLHQARNALGSALGFPPLLVFW